MREYTEPECRGDGPRPEGAVQGDIGLMSTSATIAYGCTEPAQRVAVEHSANVEFKFGQVANRLPQGLAGIDSSHLVHDQGQGAGTAAPTVLGFESLSHD